MFNQKHMATIEHITVSDIHSKGCDRRIVCDFFPEVARRHGGLLVRYFMSARRHAPGLTPTVRLKTRVK
jgi:hypothetical protein